MLVAFKNIIKIEQMRFTEYFKGFLFEIVILLRFYNSFPSFSPAYISLID